MKKRKSGIVVFAAGLLFASMTVYAAPDGMVPNSTVTGADGNTYNYYVINVEAHKDLGGWNTDDVIQFNNQFYIYGTNGWGDFATQAARPSEGSSSGSSSSTSTTASHPSTSAAKIAENRSASVQAQSIALQAAALDKGFVNVAEMQIAEALNKSAGEYYNNAVVQTPGIEEATPVAQGGNLIVDGIVTNMTATINKVDVSFVDSVRAAAEGTVLNVVDVLFPAKEATINFYMPGVTADAQIAAMQYANGVWTDVEVEEVREDHVILNLKQNGKVAFIAK